MPNLAGISGKLKVLVAAAEGNRHGYRELEGFWEITKTTLEDGIKELDEIIADIAKHYGISSEEWDL